MATTLTDHSAVDSAIGYFHQGLFALVTLLDAGDDAAVSVETADDVVLHDGMDSLHQLKHSEGNPRPLTLKNDGLWKTMAIWAAAPLDGSQTFVFVTCAEIGPTSGLDCWLTKGSDRTSLVAALEEEATRVRDARAAARSAGEPLPYATRWPGCDSFLKLSPADRKRLVDLIVVTPNSFTASLAPDEVARRLAPCVRPSIRAHFVERLIEWWDRQVVLSLLGKRPRHIQKIELQNRIADLVLEHSPDGLPDDYSLREPPSVESAGGRVMALQIEFVKGGQERLRRAVIARWRSRNQREEWLENDLATAAELDEFDTRLTELWRDRFGPMRDDCTGKPDDECRRQGLGLLDWSHHDACKAMPPIRPGWKRAFLVQGSLQQLADEAKAGWHPTYEDLLKKAGGGTL